MLGGMVGVVLGLAGSAHATETIQAELNGLSLTFDADSGAILELEYPGPGVMLKTVPEYAGLLDVAYPIPQFEPLRRASRYSHNARIEVQPDQVTIHWEELGLSRDYDVEGKVAAEVVMKAMPDGRSILLSGSIDNQSNVAVRQVLFPDLLGLLPFEGDVWTELRTCGFLLRPFQTLQPRTDATFYPTAGAEDIEYTGGSLFTAMYGRWVDFGGLTGGLSFFPRVWINTPHTRIRLHRTETYKTLRFSYVQDVTVAPDSQWRSPEYVLTPHAHGWAKGIEPYQEYVDNHVERVAPMPEHVRKGLGYRTIWMCKGYPSEGTRDIDFSVDELPAVAAECKAHGLDELVIWFWQPPFQMPAWPPYEHLGSKEDFAAAVEKCRAIGVNVSLFISWVSISHPSAERYGVTVVPGGWNYHPEMVPRMNPPYAGERATGGVDPANELWRKDVIESCRWMFNEISPSLCWDQVMGDPVAGHMYDLFAQLRKMAREIDPESTFSGESVYSIEKDSGYLDYTWNWINYRDMQPFVATFPAPRVNANINRFMPHVKYCFMDNIYMNVMPSEPDNANATAWLRDCPEISAAVKTCAALRERFLDYFVEGRIVGYGVLTEAAYGCYVNAYTRSDRALVLAMNVIGAQDFPMKIDLRPWLESPADAYELRVYNGQGQCLDTVALEVPAWAGQTGRLEAWEMRLYEFVPRK